MIEYQGEWIEGPDSRPPRKPYWENVPNDSWKTQKGETIKIEDLEDDHLIHILNFLERWAKQQKRLNDDELEYPSFNGDMAQYYAEAEYHASLDRSWHEYLPDVYAKLSEEAVKRGFIPKEASFESMLEA